MEKLSVNDFLLLVEKTSFKDLFTLCSTSKRIKDLCIANKDYIVRIFLKKIYSNELIQLLLDINNTYDIFHMNKVVQKYFNKIKISDPEEFAEIFQDSTIYIVKNTGDIFLGYKTYILPLPKSYYDNKIDVSLYINDDYVRFNSSLRNIAKNLLNDKNVKSNFDIIMINMLVPEYKLLSNEIKHKEEVFEENFKKGSSIYNMSMERLRHLKNLLKVIQ